MGHALTFRRRPTLPSPSIDTGGEQSHRPNQSRRHANGLQSSRRDGKELYVTTGRGNSVLIIDTKTNAVAAKIPVGERVWGLALSPDGSKLYTANGASNDVSVVDLKARKEITRVKVGDGPWGIAIGPKR